MPPARLKVTCDLYQARYNTHCSALDWSDPAVAQGTGDVFPLPWHSCLTWFSGDHTCRGFPPSSQTSFLVFFSFPTSVPWDASGAQCWALLSTFSEPLGNLSFVFKCDFCSHNSCHLYLQPRYVPWAPDGCISPPDTFTCMPAGCLNTDVSKISPHSVPHTVCPQASASWDDDATLTSGANICRHLWLFPFSQNHIQSENSLTSPFKGYDLSPPLPASSTLPLRSSHTVLPGLDYCRSLCRVFLSLSLLPQKLFSTQDLVRSFLRGEETLCKTFQWPVNAASSPYQHPYLVCSPMTCSLASVSCFLALVPSAGATQRRWCPHSPPSCADSGFSVCCWPRVQGSSPQMCPWLLLLTSFSFHLTSPDFWVQPGHPV